jgi:hypothetical protein
MENVKELCKALEAYKHTDVIAVHRDMILEHIYVIVARVKELKQEEWAGFLLDDKQH